MAAGASVVFTWRDALTGAWQGHNYDVAISG
jgi:hypothetical protein